MEIGGVRSEIGWVRKSTHERREGGGVGGGAKEDGEKGGERRKEGWGNKGQHIRSAIQILAPI